MIQGAGSHGNPITAFLPLVSLSRHRREVVVSSTTTSFDPLGLSPLNAAQLLAHDRQVLGQLHHGDDDGSNNQGAGGPEEGVEDGDPPVDRGQDGAVHLVRRVDVARHRLLGLETLRDVQDHGVRRRVVLPTLWNVEALRGD